jgi:hypothetical protein
MQTTPSVSTKKNRPLIIPPPLTATHVMTRTCSKGAWHLWLSVFRDGFVRLQRRFPRRRRSKRSASSTDCANATR